MGPQRLRRGPWGLSGFAGAHGAPFAAAHGAHLEPMSQWSALWNYLGPLGALPIFEKQKVAKTRASIFGIAGRPADFLKIAPGPIFNPRGGENRFPHAKIFRFHLLKPYFDRFLKNQNFKKSIFSKIDHFFTFKMWSKSNAAWKNTSGVLLWDFLAWWEAHWCPAKVQVR